MFKTRIRVAALALFTASFFGATAAHADNYGCEVMLCMSNPAGPMAVGACVPPIKKLLLGLAKWKPDPWPTCEEATGTDMQFTVKYYDDCPSGTATLEEGGVIVQMAAAQFNALAVDGYLVTRDYNTFSQVVGIGEGNGAEDRAKVCIGSALGILRYEEMGDYGSIANTISYPVFDQLIFLSRRASPYIANIYINGKLFKSTNF